MSDLAKQSSAESIFNLCEKIRKLETTVASCEEELHDEKIRIYGLLRGRREDERIIIEMRKKITIYETALFKLVDSDLGYESIIAKQALKSAKELDK